jgi:hypothetical protein
MNTSLEDLVREAQHRQADNAVAPERIRAALPRRAARTARRRRTGFFAVVGAGVAGLAAVVVPVVMTNGTGPVVALPGAPKTSATVVPGPFSLAPTTLRFKPTWLPGGFVERQRMVTAVNDNPTIDYEMRSWSKEPVNDHGEVQGNLISLQVNPGKLPPTPSTGAGDSATVGGKPAHFVGADGSKSYVEWQVDGSSIASVSSHGSVSKTDLLRIAESVRADKAVVTSPLTVGAPPAGVQVQGASFTGDSPSRWQFTMHGDENVVTPSGGDKNRGNKRTAKGIEVYYGTFKPAPAGGETVTVGGHPGRVLKSTQDAGLDGRSYDMDQWWLEVDLGQGRYLTVVSYALGRDATVALAGSVKVTAEPDLSWLGKA